jgi:hypothetical protein
MVNSRVLRPVACRLALVSLLTLPTTIAKAQDAYLPLQTGITGSTPNEDRSNPTSMLGSADVQRLILEIAGRPAPRAQIETVIRGKVFGVDDMVRVGLLREEQGLYWIDFNLLRVNDQRAIMQASEAMGRDLAQAFLARRQEFEALAAGHRQPGVGAPELLYVILGCFALDWDGLALTEGLGYRERAQRTIDGRSFTPWAKERGGDISLKGLFWGSHNSTGARFTFTTFGDHHSVPRFGIPDMLRGTRGAFTQYQNIPQAQRAGGALLTAYAGDALDDIALMMGLLRSRALLRAELATEAALAPRKFEAILDLLEALDYVRPDGERLVAGAVVLTPEDSSLVQATRLLARDVMVAWHERNYKALRGRLSGITPLRNRVPFERVYTSVWHYVFGIANRSLVEAGFFADPYGPDRRHQGFLPAIWAKGLAQLP